MARPRKCRRISLNPLVRFYKPQGIPVRQLDVIPLKEEELEALSLIDIQGMDHESAAAQMHVSRPTFSRILADAHKAVALALVSGAALKIEGGHFALHDEETTKGENNAKHG
jgi:predicted DNA-binding protein (UPF0251 family)